MVQYKLVCLTLLFVSLSSFSQSYKLSGSVVSQDEEPLGSAYIYLDDAVYYTDDRGNYSIEGVARGTHDLSVSMLGFQTLDTLINLKKNDALKFKLKEAVSNLDEVALQGRVKARNTQNSLLIHKDYIQQQFDGSLAKSLEKLPGFNAMEIGSGASKPIIRGLGLNRVAVTENGIKQEGQQWGADHGLEIDALNVENIEILKGVGAIAYGSDAIGGVVKMNNTKVPAPQGLSGSVYSFAKTVNDGIGSSVNLQFRKDNLFYKAKFTGITYADYNIPTEQISYLNFDIPIYDEQLKNSAGRELDWYGQVGYLGQAFETTLSVSNVYQKSGFFPGSHGIPDVNRALPDGDTRNIEFPYQKVNHLKIINNSVYRFNNGASFKLDLSYQNNHRQEWSLFHTHYAGQLPPERDPNLELDFDLDTYDIQMRYEQAFWDNHNTQLGVQLKWQDNDIRGFNYLLPEYTRSNYAAFLTHEYSREKTVYSLGLRYDFGTMKSERYYDETLYEYLLNNGQDEDSAAGYALRGAPIDRSFGNFNIMTGFLYEFATNWDLKINAGTSFRLPTAIELGSNGIHHGSFRHEQGDADLNPEQGVVADLKVSYDNANNGLQLSVNPYAYYFSNYIFINPTGRFSVLPHSGQLFQYTESEALLSGLEMSVSKLFFNRLRTLAVGEYLYNKQITSERSRNFPLPFTPANNLFLEAGYQLFRDSETFHNVEVFGNSRLVMEQDRIAQGEEITPGYVLYGLGLNGTLHIGDFTASLNFSVTNLLNTKFFNHTSFYRRLQIPEMGRNIQLSVKIPFGEL